MKKKHVKPRTRVAFNTGTRPHKSPKDYRRIDNLRAIRDGTEQ